MNNQKKNIDDMLDAVDQLLPLAKINEQQQADSRTTPRQLAEDLKALIPEAGSD